MIAIHLRRAGAKKDPHYRVVVSDSRKARDGAFIEILGHYHPRYEPAKVVLDVDKVNEWIAKGAQPSDTVRSLMRQVESGAVDDAGAPSPAARGANAQDAAAPPAGAAVADAGASADAGAEVAVNAAAVADAGAEVAADEAAAPDAGAEVAAAPEVAADAGAEAAAAPQTGAANAAEAPPADKE